MRFKSQEDRDLFLEKFYREIIKPLKKIIDENEDLKLVIVANPDRHKVYFDADNAFDEVAFEKFLNTDLTAEGC